MYDDIGECIICEKESDITCVCKKFEYCSRDCQVAHWREHGHKNTCTGEAEDEANSEEPEEREPQYSFFFDGVLEMCEKDRRQQEEDLNRERYDKYRGDDPRIVRWGQLLSEYADTGVNPLISYGLRARQHPRKRGDRVMRARVESDGAVPNVEHRQLTNHQMKRRVPRTEHGNPGKLKQVYTCSICQREYATPKAMKCHITKYHPKATESDYLDSTKPSLMNTGQSVPAQTVLAASEVTQLANTTKEPDIHSMAPNNPLAVSNSTHTTTEALEIAKTLPIAGEVPNPIE